MQKLKFTTQISAPASQVYQTMLGLNNIKTYEQWTAVFNPTSTYKGTWKKGEKIYFIGTTEDGKQGGMISEIADLIPNQFVSIHHLGILDGSKEVYEGPEVEEWAGGHENYSFKEKDGITTVTVDTDVTPQFLDYFNESWPKALERLKEISE